MSSFAIGIASRLPPHHVTVDSRGTCARCRQLLRTRSSSARARDCPCFRRRRVGTMARRTLTMNVSTADTRPAAGPPRISHGDLRLLIDGEWLTAHGRRTMPVVNPATEEVLGELPLASAADLDRALDAARRAWPVWRSMAPVQRARILRRAAEILRSRVEEIARLATLGEGRTLAEPRIEVGMSANIFEWYAEEGRRAYGRVLPQQSPGVRMTVVREPVGPGAAFAPWDFT